MPPIQYGPRREVLIATLGHAPSVVTSALDLLHDDGRIIQEICIVHTVPRESNGTAEPADGRMLASIAALQAVFPGDSIYRHSQRTLPCAVRWTPLAHEDEPIRDIRSGDDAGAVFRTIYTVVQHYKNEGARVHLSIAGGRKALVVYGMAVAQLLFDAGDRLWHVNATDEFIESRRLHPRPRIDAHLVPVPVLSLGLAYAGPMAALLTTDDPVAAIDEQTRRLEAAAVETCRDFLDRVLTPQERRLTMCVVRAAAHEGQAPSTEYLGRVLALSDSAVRRRLSDIYEKMRVHFVLNAPADSRVLVGLLAPHLERMAS